MGSLSLFSEQKRRFESQVGRTRRETDRHADGASWARPASLSGGSSRALSREQVDRVRLHRAARVPGLIAPTKDLGRSFQESWKTLKAGVPAFRSFPAGGGATQRSEG
jgi:hypothetical protein